MATEPLLEHETLDVYRTALSFDALASRAVPKRGHRVLRDQLDRASIGIVLCIAEGAGRRSAPDKRRFYEMARGSATESAAVLDILRARGLLSDDAHASARRLLVRIVQMLTRMSGAPRDP
jgi:four helix bundle protein